MNIFAVIGVTNSEKVGKFIQAKFPSHFIEIKEGEWFISSNKTTTEITEFFLEEKMGNEDTFIIVPVTNWNGWHVENIWEWLTLKTKAVTVDEHGK